MFVIWKKSISTSRPLHVDQYTVRSKRDTNVLISEVTQVMVGTAKKELPHKPTKTLLTLCWVALALGLLVFGFLFLLNAYFGLLMELSGAEDGFSLGANASTYSLTGSVLGLVGVVTIQILQAVFKGLSSRNGLKLISSQGTFFYPCSDFAYMHKVIDEINQIRLKLKAEEETRKAGSTTYIGSIGTIESGGGSVTIGSGNKVISTSNAI